MPDQDIVEAFQDLFGRLHFDPLPKDFTKPEPCGIEGCQLSGIAPHWHQPEWLPEQPPTPSEEK